MINYSESKNGHNVLKDGHTMFNFDIAKELNRKSYLEGVATTQYQEITELKAKLSLADAIINKRVDNDIKIKAQIERYQKLVCQTCDGHGAVGNILDSMDCPECTLYVGPSEEIEALKAELEQHDDQITNIEIANKELVAIAEKKGYWQGFETGSVKPGGNILVHYNGWLDFKASNEKYIQERK